MSLPGRIGGESLELLSWDGSQFVFISPRAFAPGQPMPVTIDGDQPFALDLKSTGSVRREDGKYTVRARATTLHKSSRARLLAAFPQAAN